MGSKGETNISWKKKGRDNALNDLTNKLDTGPVKRKASWAGPKLSLGVLKETEKVQRTGLGPRDESRIGPGKSTTIMSP